MARTQGALISGGYGRRLRTPYTRRPAGPPAMRAHSKAAHTSPAMEQVGEHRYPGPARRPLARARRRLRQSRIAGTASGLTRDAGSAAMARPSSPTTGSTPSGPCCLGRPSDRSAVTDPGSRARSMAAVRWAPFHRGRYGWHATRHRAPLLVERDRKRMARARDRVEPRIERRLPSSEPRSPARRSRLVTVGEAQAVGISRRDASGTRMVSARP